MRTLSLALLLAATTAAHAGDHNELSIGGGGRALRSNSANAVTSDTLSHGELAYGRRLDLSLVPRLQTWLTAGFNWGGASGTLFQSMATEVDTLGFTGGARARYVLHPHFAATARVDLGTARTALALDGNAGRVSDAGWGATFGAALGAEAYMIAHPTFSLGVRFELGYVTMTAPALSPRASEDDSMILLDAQQASIGHLDLGGRYASFAMISRF
ncbi:MAG TPA: hypothetical protein VM513_20190 [Kofleriaceae bacterium]|nr:hypothetical protein [Kofleriaceae bacterium]